MRPDAVPTQYGRVRISVLVPSYNSAPFLRQALASALDQVPSPHELLVQDGGSTDETLDILRSFGDRVLWTSGPDGGQSDALNKALTRATGDVVIWLNADDMLCPGALAAATDAFSADSDLAFAYGHFDVIDAAGGLIRRFTSSTYSWERIFRKGCYIFSGSLFIRRQALNDVGRFDASLRACMDLDLMLRLNTAGKSVHLGRTIAQFRIHGAGKSSRMGLTFIREGFRVRHRYLGGSPRLWLHSVRLGLVESLIQFASPLRYSRLWPRHGRGKTL